MNTLNKPNTDKQTLQAIARQYQDIEQRHAYELAVDGRAFGALKDLSARPTEDELRQSRQKFADKLNELVRQRQRLFSEFRQSLLNSFEQYDSLSGCTLLREHVNRHLHVYRRISLEVRIAGEAADLLGRLEKDLTQLPAITVHARHVEQRNVLRQQQIDGLHQGLRSGLRLLTSRFNALHGSSRVVELVLRRHGFICEVLLTEQQRARSDDLARRVQNDSGNQFVIITPACRVYIRPLDGHHLVVKYAEGGGYELCYYGYGPGSWGFTAETSCIELDGYGRRLEGGFVEIGGGSASFHKGRERLAQIAGLLEVSESLSLEAPKITDLDYYSTAKLLEVAARGDAIPVVRGPGSSFSDTRIVPGWRIPGDGEKLVGSISTTEEFTLP
jgi:hypothetical protein